MSDVMHDLDESGDVIEAKANPSQAKHAVIGGPNGPITLTTGEQRDIHHILDLLASSLDWGSGFLSNEDVEAWNRAAKAVDYPAVAVAEAHADSDGNVANPPSYGWVLKTLKKCPSRHDTSVEPKRKGASRKPVSLKCVLPLGHRGMHFAADPVEKTWG